MVRTTWIRLRNLSATLGERSSLLGWSMALIATLAFSIAPPVAKGAILGGMAPTTLLTVRLVIAALFLGATLGLAAPGRLRLDRRGVLICVLGGSASGIGMVCFFLALDRLSASITAMIFSLNPLVALALLALRGEKFTHRHTLRLALGLGGVYLLIGPDNAAGAGVDLLGVGLVMVTIFTVAIQLSLLQWFLKGYDARTVTLYLVTLMMVVSMGMWLVQGAEWHDPGWSGWLAIIILAVVSTYISRLALFAAVRHLGSGQMALLFPFETLLTVIWSVLFLQERLTLWQWLGGGLILFSAILAINRLRWSGRRLRLRNWSRP